MIKRIFTTLLIAFGVFTMSFGQDYFIPLGSKSSDAVVLQSSHHGLNMQFTLEGVLGKNVQSTKGQNFTELYFGKGYSAGELGAPKLPAFKKLIQIPHGATVNLNVIGYSEQEISLADYGITTKVYPMQRSLRKDEDVINSPFIYDETAYSLNEYKETPIAHIEVLGTLRGARIARLEVYPVDYNPVTETIKVYNDIEVEVQFEGVDENLQKEIFAKTWSPYFEPVYSTLANPVTKGAFDDHPDLVNYPIGMLIVSHRMFEDAIAPFVEWKTQKGFYVEVAYTDEIGTSTNAIKTFVHDKYNNPTGGQPAPSFLVLMGDIQQVPSTGVGSSSGKHTDLYYASVDGDMFPDMYYGRFSAQTVAQMENIVEKILYYEKYQFEDPTYLNNATFIAGADSYWNPKLGQPAVKYATANYYNSNNGYETVWGYGIANDPNNPNNSSGYTGCYTNERISVSVINYTAHCNQTSWGDPLLSISAVNAMTNTNKYPLSIGNCCMSADFGYNESIGEAWIRGKQKGAVTYIGSSPNSYWFEDFYWAVGAFPLTGNNDGYIPTVEESSLGAYDAPFISDYTTTGGLIAVGNLAVTEVHLQNYPSHSSPLYYWQAYNVLGDPSLIAYHTEGETNTVNHMDIVPIGLDRYTVEALPGSLVAISMDGVLHGTALVDDSGEVEVQMTPIMDSGDVDIVITRPQTIPYMVQVPAAALEGPYIVLEGYEINDTAGNNNGEADFGEIIKLNISLKNVGADPGQSVKAKLSGTDEYFTIVDGAFVNFGAIPTDDPNNVVTVNDAFTLKVGNNIPDQYQATFYLDIEDGDKTWEASLKIIANAPVFTYGELSIDDSDTGNGNNLLDPGEEGKVLISLTNDGHADMGSFNTTLATTSNLAEIVNGTFAVTSLEAGQSVTLEYTVSISSDATDGSVANLAAKTVAGEYVVEAQYELVIGFVPEYCISGATSNQYSDLLGFTFGPLENYTEPGGTYDDFTDDPELVHEFMRGFTYPVSVTLGSVGATYTKGAKVFVDWNYDGMFIEPQETAFTVMPQNANWTAEGTITIPADAPLGQKFVRVVVRETSNINDIKPCGTFSWGGTEDYRIIIVEPQAPVANFTGTPRVTVEGDVVRFTDLTTNDPASWSWEITPGVAGTDWKFVETTTATSQHPRVQFLTANNYTVALTATNPAGSNTKTEPDYITINELNDVPVAGFMVDKPEILPGEVVQLTDTSNNLPISWTWIVSPGIQNTDWAFVDETGSSSQHPRIKFNKVGNYTIRLIATNIVGPSEPFILPDAVIVLSEYNMHTGTLTTCNGLFYDSGGADGNYGNNENHTLTVYPKGANKALRVVFSKVDIEANNDKLEVYNGTSASGEPMAVITGKELPDTLVATNNDGALTFVFTSNSSVNRAGWEARFGCEDLGTWVPTDGLINVQSYPNPFNSHLTLEGLAEVRKIELFNLLGQKVLEVPAYGEDIVTLNTQDIQAGVYMIRLSGENGILSLLKVVKQ